MRLLARIGLALTLCAPALLAEASFDGAKVSDVIRIRLDRGDLLLESILRAVEMHKIEDGSVTTGVGTVQQCTYHGVKSLAAQAEQQFHTVEGPIEVLNLNGIIAAKEPHIHITMADPKGVFGGHLEKGCKVLYRAEITILKFSGTALARKANAQGIPMLQPR